MFLFVFWLRNRPSVINRYATGGIERAHQNSVQVRTGREGYHVSCVRAPCVPYLFSYFCLIVSCLISGNLTLTSFKKGVFVRKGYFSPMRSVSVVMK